MSRWLASLVMATAAMAGAAQAQETGSMRPDSAPIDVAEGRSTGDAARAVYDNFALCIVKRHYLQVRKALAGPPNLAKDYESLPKLMDKACFFGSGSVGRIGGGQSVELTTNPLSFRGALYKALVRKDYLRRPVPFGPTALTMTGDNSDAIQFAGCVVRHDPEGSLKLFKASAGTTVERAAIAALTPHLDQCSAQGRSIPRGILIGFLAEAYYREADASKSTSSH